VGGGASQGGIEHGGENQGGSGRHGVRANFAPIIRDHPDSELYALCRRNAAELERSGKALGVSRLYTDFADMLTVKELDAVLIISRWPRTMP